MSALRDWLSQLDFSWFVNTLITVLAALVCITLHELCHGFVAWKLGDPTAKRAGRLSLNPLRHVDIPGLIMMAVFKFGWAKPVPVDMQYFKKPKSGMALVALAGPVSNVLLAFAALLSYWGILLLGGSDGIWEYFLLFFSYTALLSCGLAVFNFIPIPPLDGSKVFAVFLPDRAYLKLMKWEKYGIILLFVILYVGVLDVPLDFLRSGLLQFLSDAALLPYRLVLKFTF